MRVFPAAALLALVATVLAAPAQAGSRHFYWHHRQQHGAVHDTHESHGHGGFGDARPAAWCGWYMRQVMGVTDRAYNRAGNWAHWGRAAAGPQIGAVVVWPHHVGEIVAYAGDGRWLVRSGNDGHAVRTRPRSLAGAIAFRLGDSGYQPKHGDWGAF
jgi:hypothetical protein